jgi:MFS family permease
VVVGWLVERTEPRGLFLVFVPMLVFTALIGFGLRPRGVVSPMPRLTGVAAVIRNPLLGRFLLAILLTWSASSALNAYLSIYLGQIGAPDTLIGIAWAIGAAVEVPLMIAFPQLARRFGVERLILLGAACLVVRMLLITFLREPLLVTSTSVLHGASFAFLTIGGVTYVARHAPLGTATTAQGVLTAVAYSLATICGPTVAGLLAGVFALPQVFAIMSVVSLCGVVALLWALRPGLRGGSAEPEADQPAASIDAVPLSPP